MIRPADADEYSDRMGAVMLSRNEDGMAQRRFERLVDEHPDSAGPQGGLALARCRLGRVAQASEPLARAQALDPDQPLVLAAQACLAAAGGDHSGEEQWLQRAAERSSKPKHIRELARYWMRHGQYVRAEEMLGEVSTAGMYGPSATALRAVCKVALGDTDGALGQLVMIRVPDRMDTTSETAQTYVALADDLTLETVAVPFDRITRVNQGNDLVVARAEAMRRLGRLDEAEVEIGRRKLDIDDPYADAVAARLATDMGRRGVARSIIAGAYDRWPEHGSVFLSEAYLLAAEGNLRAAERLLVHARAVGIPAWDWPVAADVERAMDRLD